MEENKEGKIVKPFTRLSEKVITLLQRQVKHEAGNNNLYTALSNWCDIKGLKGFKSYFAKQSEEETNHKKVFSEYLLGKNVSVPAPLIEGFTVDCMCLNDCLATSLVRETLTTKMIGELATVSLSEKDYQTYELALSMIKEQVSEEAQFINLIDRLKLCSDYFLDLEQK